MGIWAASNFWLLICMYMYLFEYQFYFFWVYKHLLWCVACSPCACCGQNHLPPLQMRTSWLGALATERQGQLPVCSPLGPPQGGGAKGQKSVERQGFPSGSTAFQPSGPAQCVWVSCPPLWALCAERSRTPPTSLATRGR